MDSIMRWSMMIDDNIYFERIVAERTILGKEVKYTVEKKILKKE